ncbi:MAG: hypothetical protein K2G49_00280 [Muribaculum sp.]|nr:hypothetical protein [Muribaculum sp.]
MQCRGEWKLARGDIHAVICMRDVLWHVHVVMYMQCRGEWKLARVASRGGIVVYPAGKWRHCVYFGRASTRPYIACVWGACG